MNIPFNNDRRANPRYEDRILVDLHIDDSAVLPVETCSVSAAGIQFICDSWIVNEIEPKGAQQLALSKKDISIETKLPFDNFSKSFTAHSHVCAVRRLSQNQYLLGLRFDSFEDDSEIHLEEYIEQLKNDIESRVSTKESPTY